MTISLPQMSHRIASLPRDERGYPVPWFVAWIDGKPEFRCAAGEKLQQAIDGRLCWVCGQKIDRRKPLAFVIGPMCSINRISSEPHCHLDCAVFSAKACPFLTMPKAHRREANLPKEGYDPGGFFIKRNPGVCLIWVTHRYGMLHLQEGGCLFELGDPLQTLWFAAGRQATRDEILESIESGLPILQKEARRGGRQAMEELERRRTNAMCLIPG